MKNKEPRPYNLIWIKLFIHLTYYVKVLSIHLDYYTQSMISHNQIVADYMKNKIAKELYK
ncbi:MAG: hypothetical protein EBU90_00915 [Proteobacteria bacterium]|nr:hypothetical protein [Pseudomonadota bacterium]NBP12994.1 hypothetical protein [bacterium]